MVSHHDPFLRRVDIPGNRHGRQVGRRDKLIAIAFGAVVLLGFWWFVFRPEPYTIMESDFHAIAHVGWAERNHKRAEVVVERLVKQVSYIELVSGYEDSPRKAFIATSTGGGAMAHIRELALIAQAEMLLDEDGRYPDAVRKELSKAIVVCADPELCSRIVKSAIRNARERAADQRAAEYFD